MTVFSAWTYRGWSLDVDRIHKYAVELVYLDGRDDVRPTIDELRGAGVGVGVYVVATWPEVPANPVAAAQWTANRLDLLVPRAGLSVAPAMIELESTTISYQAEFLREYRRHEPRRPTSVAVAALQGGLVNVAAIGVAGCDLFVETYYTNPDGTLRPADRAACVLEQARRLGADRVHPFYDGADLPYDHLRDGCVFTLERLSL